VTVSGTPDQRSAATSVDRTFTTGQRYLFVPSSPGSPFQDNNCSLTGLYSSQLDSLKPATSRSPSPGSDGLDPTGLAFVPLWVWLSVGATILIVGVGSGLLLRRRPRPRLRSGG
jgi:hypothetical protein